MNRGDFYLMPFLFVLLRVNNFKPKQNCGNSLIIVMFAQSLKYVSTLIKVNWHATINILRQLLIPYHSVRASKFVLSKTRKMNTINKSFILK